MTKNNKEIKSKIEYQEVLAEAPRRGYEIIRLSRIKYKENPDTFIDLRLFQIDHGTDDETLHPTKKGIQFKEDDFQRLIGKWTLVPSLLFHRVILRKSWPHIERSEFDDAVFKAFKSVEIEVRKACGYSSELIGVKLMREAFDPENGPLTDYTVPKAERQALADLFCGTTGLYKNPFSHRDVELEFNEAFEMLLLASHLLNIIDKRKRMKKS
ncbi:MAG TPA: TIGR02391 family protein [Candidatus Wujingus californicus]|uniref:TIGR02391 family protein n=1 Tax=Candidatus Wujingus californicus TaxID=3367618 RepID=UPI001D8B55E9|nr:TIGR02391 family protein [Planctomycetota bacterium]MDO8131852.1 TIGR02391 family protein [Candidatus Brocadiales bacterium]